MREFCGVPGISRAERTWLGSGGACCPGAPVSDRLIALRLLCQGSFDGNPADGLEVQSRLQAGAPLRGRYRYTFRLSFHPGPLAWEPVFAYIPGMTSVEIIEEIKRLPQAEQNRVIDFIRQAGATRPLTPGELGELANAMVAAKDPAEADRLQAEIVRGFYGGPANA